MSEDLQTPAPGEAGNDGAETEAVEAESEATENTTGQEEGQPAESAPDEEETRSRSKERRERRKAENERLRTEAQALREKLERAQGRLSQYEQPGKQPPRYEDFSDHDAYMAALAAHHAGTAIDERWKSEAQREAEETRRQYETVEHARQAEAQRNWAAQREEAAARYADFDAVTTAQDVPISPHMAQHIMQSDNGADVAYFLGTNKADAVMIARLPPEQQAGAMAILEKFVTKTAPRPRTQTSAPDPVTTVKAKGAGMKPVADMSMEEYAAARAAGKIK